MKNNQPYLPKKWNIDNLIIEITRKCNMKYHHCLRGTAQRIDIQPQFIKTFLQHVSSIKELTISGGEPSLNVTGIRFLLNELKRRRIEVDNFYIVTNGSKSSLSQAFMETCIDLYNYQNTKVGDDDFHSLLQMSYDNYHDQILHHKVISQLKIYSFFSIRKNNYTKDNLLKEGRSKEGRLLSVVNWYYDEDTLYGDVYLNALGELTTHYDMSYRSQKKFKVCTVDTFPTYVQSLISPDSLVA